MSIKKFLKRLAGRIPEELPRDDAQLDRFIESIVSTYGLPNTPAYQRTIVTMIQHLSQERHKAPKYYFYRAIGRAEAMKAAFWKLRALSEAEKQAATPPKGDAIVGEITTEDPASGVGPAT